MYLRYKNRGSLFMKYRRCIFAGEKSPCGSALGHTELRKYMFYVFKTRTSRLSIFKKYRRCFFGGTKSPCGSAPGRTELRKYMFYVFKTHKSRFSISKNKITYFEKIKGFCHDPTSDLPPRFSDGNMKNSIPVNLFRR